MPDFDFVLAEVDRVEGGYSNDPNDRGGETYRGISEMHRNRFVTWPPTEEATKEFYHQWFIDIGLDQLPVTDQVAAYLFLFIINTTAPGTWGDAPELLQVALNAVGEGVKVDGGIGPRTKLALQYAPKDALMRHLQTAIAAKYTGFRQFGHYGEAWLKRRVRFGVESM